MIFFGGEILPFYEKYHVPIFLFKIKKKITKKRFLKSKKKTQQIPTIAYNMKGCLRLPTFIFFKNCQID
jgi:hypothetical protein